MQTYHGSRVSPSSGELSSRHYFLQYLLWKRNCCFSLSPFPFHFLNFSFTLCNFPIVSIALPPLPLWLCRKRVLNSKLRASTSSTSLWVNPISTRPITSRLLGNKLLPTTGRAIVLCLVISIFVKLSALNWSVKMDCTTNPHRSWWAMVPNKRCATCCSLW